MITVAVDDLGLHTRLGTLLNFVRELDFFIDGGA
jgi:hypothetical protein